MKKPFFRLSPFVLGMLIAGTSLLGIMSCGKNNANAAFLGTYAGTTTDVSTGYFANDTAVVSARGSSGVTILLKAGNATINGTVAGTTLTIPSQNGSFNGNSVPVSGTGQLSGKTLTVTLHETIGGTNINYVFSGSKP
jgi:hypothetical protein